MQVGDTITFVPHFMEGELRERHGKRQRPREVTGTVVWIHPKRRFFEVEYILNGTKLRQSLYFKHKN